MELIRNKLNTNNRILRENLGSVADRQTDRPGERWTRQTDKQIDRQTADRQTDRRTGTKTQTDVRRRGIRSKVRNIGDA